MQFPNSENAQHNLEIARISRIQWNIYTAGKHRTRGGRERDGPWLKILSLTTREKQ